MIWKTRVIAVLGFSPGRSSTPFQGSFRGVRRNAIPVPSQKHARKLADDAADPETMPS